MAGRVSEGDGVSLTPVSPSVISSRCSGVSRRASSIFFCASMSPSLLGRREAFRPGTEDVDFDFIALSYMETTCPSPLMSMTLWRLSCNDGNTFAVRLDSRRLCQMAQSEIGRSISPYSRSFPSVSRSSAC